MFIFRKWVMKVAPVFFLLIFSSLSLSGCGGGGSSGGGGGSESENGQVLLSLTDAEGDFVNYTVDVLSIKLERRDGTQVETLPMNTRVDFAQYTEMTEFLTAASVPKGVYVKGSIVLDYSNADIWVEDSNGAAVKVTEILDSNGNPITTLEVKVTLDGRSELPIAPGIPKNLMLDFDLEKSHVVTVANPVSITVDPVFVVDVDPQAPRIHRIRGPLKDVDVAASQFEVYIRPFYHRIGTDGRVFGTLKVLTNDATIFEINGTAFSGNDGLQTLSEQTQFTAVIARGDLKFNPLRFEASEVYAGISVPGGDKDVARGSVTSRNGDQIVVKGATLFRADGNIVFNDSITITLDASTTVTKQLNVGTFSKDDISVGQRITVFGTITNDMTDDLQMSAANGYARMRISSVKGTVGLLPDVANDLELNVESINGRNISIYNFAGTGVDAGSDASATNYEVDTGTLSLDTIAVDDKVAVRGFPTAFGTAPADYVAQSVIERTEP